jgi:hypothetical protein
VQKKREKKRTREDWDGRVGKGRWYFGERTKFGQKSCFSL